MNLFILMEVPAHTAVAVGAAEEHRRMDINGLMESPTFTASSGSRDRDTATPKSSISAGPISLADSFGYLGLDRERDRDRELEMAREMKERHGTEMGALSDSQRTARVLREENSDLSRTGWKGSQRLFKQGVTTGARGFTERMR